MTELNKKLYVIKQQAPILYSALNYHKTHTNKNITFQNHLYLKDIFLDKSDYKVIIKSSQCGISEYLLIFAIYDANLGRNILYVLPTFDMMSKFVSTRFNPSLGYSDYYKNIIEQGKKDNYKQSESTSIKNIGDGTIIFVGTHTAKGFISHPCDTIVVDEEDQCDAKNLALAFSRLSHSKHKKQLYVSNPTIEGLAIDDRYADTDKKIWMIKCEHCNEWINPDWFKHVVREVEENTFTIIDKEYEKGSNNLNAICDKCQRPFDRFVKGNWVAESESYKSGYRISKMFSSFDTLIEMMERFEEGLVNDNKMQAFYNMDLGLAFTPTGAKIDDNMLNACVSDHVLKSNSVNPCIAGIDTGSVYNIIIGELINDKIKIIVIRELNSYEELLELMKQYKIIGFVVDAGPESYVARKLIRNIPGGFMSRINSNNPVPKVNPKTKVVNSDRTATLDVVKESILTQVILLPKNAASINNFYSQMKASTRIFDEEKNRYKWEEGSKADHYFLAMAYLLLAKKIMNMICN